MLNPTEDSSPSGAPGDDWQTVPEGQQLTDEQALRRFLSWEWAEQLHYMSHLREAAAEASDHQIQGITLDAIHGLELLIADQHRELAALREGETVPAALATKMADEARAEGKREGMEAEREERRTHERRGATEALQRVRDELDAREQARPVTRAQQAADTLNDAELAAHRVTRRQGGATT